MMNLTMLSSSDYEQETEQNHKVDIFENSRYILAKKIVKSYKIVDLVNEEICYKLS